MKPNRYYTSKAITSALVLCMVMVLSHLFTGCSYYDPLWRGSPVQYGAEGSDPTLLVMQNDYGSYGYCDTSGKVVIRAQYDQARPFYEGLAAVKKGKRFGYINKEGKTVIPFRYYDALNFHNGKAFVGTEIIPFTEIHRLRCCLIDREGKILQETNYRNIGDFMNGMLPAVEEGTGKDFVFLDADYQVLPAVGYTFDGLAVTQTESGRYLYKNKDGNVAFPAVFMKARRFSDGLAAVVVGNSGLWGYIDTTGEMIIEPKYRQVADFGEGLACVQTEGGGWTIIDKSKRIKGETDLVFDTAKAFHEGLCAVGRLKEKRYYYFDDEKYDWGFIDTTGKLVIDFQYDMVSPFKNGIAQVLVDDKIGYIDKTGKYIWEPQ